MTDVEIYIAYTLILCMLGSKSPVSMSQLYLIGITWKTVVKTKVMNQIITKLHTTQTAVLNRGVWKTRL